MNEILTKISRYNLFNYLFPGVIFCILLQKILNLDLENIQNENLIILLFGFYFIGMLISRVGSLVVEPILKKIRFVKFASYSDYLKIVKIDETMEILSEENNIYRTFISLFLLLLVSYGVDYFFPEIQNPYIILICICLILFLASYRKQTKYITKRIKSYKK